MASEPGLLSQRVRALRLPQPGASAGSSTWAMGVLCLGLAGTAAVLGYLLWQEQQDKAVASAISTAQPSGPTAEDPSPAVAVATAPVQAIALESKGYIIPARQILVSPKVNGMVEHLSFQEGQRVAKGEVLAVLEKTDYEADVRRAEAMLLSAKHRLEELQRGFRPEEVSQSRAELAESEAQLAQNEADWKRAQELRKKNVISREEYDAAESRYRAQQQRVERLRFAAKLMKDGPRIERIDIARAEVQQAEAELAKARWRLDNCTIRAPISGTILKKNAEEGNVVNPIAFNGSFSLCEMADLADLEVDLTIQERDISRIFKGQKCKVRAEAFPERVYDGWVSRLMPIADRAKGAVPVRVKVAVPAEEEGVYLKPEMGAVVVFYKDKAP